MRGEQVVMKARIEGHEVGITGLEEQVSVIGAELRELGRRAWTGLDEEEEARYEPQDKGGG